MDPSSDDGLTIGALWAFAWGLGLVTVVCLIRVMSYPEPEGDVPTPRGIFAWAMAGCVAAVFSAACAVLTGLKAAERRLAERAAA